MTRRAAEGATHRILVALDASAESLAALAAAAELAARMHAELLGIFVEDINLVRLARHPVAWHVTLPSGAGEPPRAGAIEAQLEAVAVQARRALESAAKAVRVRGSFRVVRGWVTAEVLAAAEEADLLILGCSSRSLRRRGLGGTARAAAEKAPRPVLLLPHGATLDRPVVVLYDAAPDARRALAEGARLAQALGVALSVLLAAGSGAAAERLERQAGAWLKEHGVEGRLWRLVGAGAGGLEAAIKAGQQATLVLGAGSAALEGRVARRVLDQIQCPVLLVR